MNNEFINLCEVIDLELNPNILQDLENQTRYEAELQLEEDIKSIEY